MRRNDSNLVEQVDDFCQDVEASPWVDGCLVEDASLQRKGEKN